MDRLAAPAILTGRDGTGTQRARLTGKVAEPGGKPLLRRHMNAAGLLLRKFSARMLHTLTEALLPEKPPNPVTPETCGLDP